MKLAIIGSRDLVVEKIEEYIPDGVTEIVSGGARGVDSIAAEYARRRGIATTEFLPDYARYGRGAPLRRNEQIAEYADEAIAFWNGTSRGTQYTIRAFEKRGKRVIVITVDIKA